MAALSSTKLVQGLGVPLTRCVLVLLCLGHPTLSLHPSSGTCSCVAFVLVANCHAILQTQWQSSHRVRPRRPLPLNLPPICPLSLSPPLSLSHAHTYARTHARAGAPASRSWSQWPPATRWTSRPRAWTALRTTSCSRTWWVAPATWTRRTGGTPRDARARCVFWGGQLCTSVNDPGVC